MKDCPFCAEPIKDAATVCRYCGRKLPGRFDIATGGASIVLRILFWLFMLFIGIPALVAAFFAFR